MSSSSASDAPNQVIDLITTTGESSLASSKSTDEKKEGGDDSPERKAQLEADRRKELERIRSLPFAERLPAMLARQTPPLELVKDKPSDSPIWEYFSVVIPSKFAPVKAVVCLPCFEAKDEVKILKYKTYSALKSYIQHHKSQAQKIKELSLSSTRGNIVPSDASHLRKLQVEKAKAAKEGDEDKKRKAQSKLDAFMPKAKKRYSTMRNAQEIHYALALWHIMEGESNKTESPWFRHFLATLNETYVPPTAKTMSQVYEHRIHVFILDAQLQSLERALAFFTVDGVTVRFISLQFDGWTSDANYGFLGIANCYFDPEIVASVYMVLAVYLIPRGKAAVDLAAILKDVLTSYKIEVSWIAQSVTDEVGAVTNASKLLDPKIRHVPCLCHVLQTVIKHGTGLPDKPYKRDPFKEGNEYFRALRRLVSNFTTSPLETKELKEIQNCRIASQEKERLLEKERTRASGECVVDRRPQAVGMLSFQATIWGAANRVLNRTIRLKPDLTVYFQKYEVANEEPHESAISISKWKIHDQVAANLYLFDNVTVLMQGKTYPSGSYSWVFKRLVIGGLEGGIKGSIHANIGESKEDTEVKIVGKLPTAMAKRLLDGMNRRFPCPTDDELIKCFLDPRLRPLLDEENAFFFQRGHRARAIEKTMEKLEETLELLTSVDDQKENAPGTTNGPADTSAVAKRVPSYLITTQKRAPSIKTTPAKLIIDAYLAQEVFAGNLLDMLKGRCPFEWWMKHTRLIPTLKPLAVIACSLLSLPGNSSFSEFIFSYGGEQTSQKKSRLSVKRLNAKALVKFNCKVLGKTDENIRARFVKLPQEIDAILERQDKEPFGMVYCDTEGERGDTEEVQNALVQTRTGCIYCVNTALVENELLTCTQGWFTVIYQSAVAKGK